MWSLASIWRNLICHSGAVSRLPKFESMLVQSGSSNFFMCRAVTKYRVIESLRFSFCIVICHCLFIELAVDYDCHV
jgi:hypothetical protein